MAIKQPDNWNIEDKIRQEQGGWSNSALLPRGNPLDLIEVVQQYPPLNLNCVTIVAGFNDHGKPSSKVRLFFKKLIEIVTYKFQPCSIIVPQIIPSESNSAINRKIFNHNCKLHNLFKYFRPGPKIVHPRLSCFFDKSYCRDGIRFSYYVNFVLTNVLRTLIQMFSFC